MVVALARAVGADQHLVGREHQVLRHLLLADHLRGAVVAAHELAAFAHVERQPDDRIVARLAVDFGQQEVGLVLGEEAAARDRRQLRGIAEHQDRRAERLQVAAELLVDHRAFVDDDELGARHRALAVERKGRRHRGLAGRLVGHRLLAARPVDQRMDGARIGGALRAQHLRGLAGEGGELHLPVDMLGEIARQRRLAGAGIAEQAEHLRPPGLQPSRDGLQRVVLLRREFHRTCETGFAPPGQEQARVDQGAS